LRFFVTGHLGYIGVHLTDILKAAGHEVTGCDLGLFDGCEWSDCPSPDRELRKDVRSLEVGDLEGHDCVVHLAAISNDPMGDIDPEITLSINRDGSIRLGEIAKKAGVPRFIFSGSCSVYGKGEKMDLDEGDPLNPLTPYARSKIDAEKGLSALADASFAPVYLRNSTAYGHSPMLRIDLVANNLLARGLVTGQIGIMSDGTPWRPLVHCRDIARACLAFAEAPADTVRDVAVNIGADAENFQVRDVADEVQRLVPSAEITYTGEVGDDPRSYRVSFGRLRSLLPDFELEFPLRKGMDVLNADMAGGKFSVEDFEGDRFVRLRTLTKRMDMLAG